VDLQGIGTLVKYGSETVFGYKSRKLLDLAAKAGKKVESLPVKVLTSAKVQEDLRSALQDCYQQLCTDLDAAHKAYRAREVKMEKDRLIHGSITEQKQTEFDNAKKLYEKLLSIVTTLSECMVQDMPVLEVSVVLFARCLRGACAVSCIWLGVRSPKLSSAFTLPQVAPSVMSHFIITFRSVPCHISCLNGGFSLLCGRWRKRRRTVRAD
jgi:hypothetical protein